MAESLPLITYTPRYHEADCHITHLKNQQWYYGRYFKDIIEVNFELKWPGSSGLGRSGKLEKYKIQLFSENEIPQQIIDNFYIIFGGIAFTKNTGDWATMRTIFLIDNYGNKYESQGSAAPGQGFPQLGVPYDTTEYMKFFAAPFGKTNVMIDGVYPVPKSTQLPDTFIDYIVKNETRYYGQNYKPYYGNVEGIEFISIKLATEIIPHRPFEFNAETAEYIQSLETPKPIISKNTASINVQTNFMGMNKNLQTNNVSNNTRRNNRGRSGFVNVLRKKCGEKGCNTVSEEVQTNNFENGSVNKNRSRFAVTLRQKCKGKNCNKQNTAMQTQSAFIGRRHSMVNNLRKKVQSTRPE